MRRGTFLGRMVVLAIGLGVLAACGDAAGSTSAPLRIFASASLAGVLDDAVATQKSLAPDVPVELQVAGTPQLLLQIEHGAVADLLLCADPADARRVVDAGLAADAPVVFARNRMAIVHAPGNPRKIGGLADLARTDLRVALCAPGVPAGRYARAALARSGTVVRSVSDEPSVRALVMKVKQGEIDAGIVYATDLRTAGVEGHVLDSEGMPIADYPIVALKSGRNPTFAARFRAFLLGPDGRALLAHHGFSTP